MVKNRSEGTFASFNLYFILFSTFLEEVKLSVSLPTGQASQESNLPKGKNYLSRTTGRDFIQALLMMHHYRGLGSASKLLKQIFNKQRHYPDQGSDNSLLSIEFLHLFLRCQFKGKPLVLL